MTRQLLYCQTLHLVNGAYELVPLPICSVERNPLLQFCRIAYELMQSRHPDASARVASLDVDYNYAYVAFPPRRTLYTNNPAFKNELGWSRAGSLVAKLDDYDSRTEAKQKKFNDGFTTGSLVGGSKKPNTVFPKFKATQMYKVANYSALPASTAL